MTKGTVKFGIMCKNTTFSKWQVKAIEQLLDLDNVECKVLIIEDTESENLVEKVLTRFKFTNLFWLIYLLLFRNKFKATQKQDLSGVLSEIEKVKCDITRKGKPSEYFKSSDVERIKNYDLNFILKFGFGIIRGEILDVADYGVWSFHHDDEKKYRGGPPCFWEIYNNDGVTGTILQKLTDKLDTGIVLKKGFLKTKYSYIKNRDQLYLESSRWPAQLCIDIKNGRTDKFYSKPSGTSAPIYYEPTNKEFLVFLYRSIFYRLKTQLRKLFYIDYWNIGVATTEISSFLNDKKPDVTWFPLETSDKFIADPFAIFDPDNQEKPNLHIFYETYLFNENKGRIDYSSYDGKFSKKTTNILNEKYHFSYPYLISHQGNTYMVPECFANNNITIYKAKNFPQGWEEYATLIENFKGVDTTIIMYKGKWWLFTSDKNDGVHYNLKLFYSDNLFHGWMPHPKNPVKTDIRSARCAGTPFVYKGDLIRPSMDYSEKIEGRIVLNKMVTLSTTYFEEVPLKTIDPYMDSNFSDKIHTLSSAGNYTIVDGCKEYHIFQDFNFLRSKAKLLVEKIFP